MNSISRASLAVNQVYVNENVDKIVEFMGIFNEPDVIARQSGNWRRMSERRERRMP